MGIAGRGRAHVAAALAQLVRRGRKSLEQIYPKACSPTKPTEQGCMIPEKNRIHHFFFWGSESRSLFSGTQCSKHDIRELG